MDRNNKGKAVLIESDNNSPVILDYDEQSFQDMETSFENCCHQCKANSCTIGGRPFVEDFPSLPYDIFDGLPNLDTGGIFGDPNQQKSPSANNTLGFNLTLPVEAKSLTIEGNTICGNQSNTSMAQGGIYGDPGFFNNAPVPSSSEACTEATPRKILKFMKPSRGAPKDLLLENMSPVIFSSGKETHNFTSMIQKIRLKVKRMEDALRDEIMNTTYHLGLSSSPQQLATAAGNMCLQPNVGTQVLQNIRLPLSSGTIEGTIIQDQALFTNVAGIFNNTSLPSSSQYEAVDANETAMPGNGPNYFTRQESPVDDFLNSSQDCGINFEVLGAECSLPSSSQDQAVGNGLNNTSDDTDFDNIEDWLNDYYMSP